MPDAAPAAIVVDAGAGAGSAAGSATGSAGSGDAGESGGSAGSAATRTPNRASAIALAHLRNAEQALRANNRLRQLAEADLALRADPRNQRAKYLLGDALIKTGAIDRGCKYLRELKRNSAAQTRAREAGCPAH